MGDRVAFVFDVESRGNSHIRNGIVSIGVCIGKLNTVQVLEKVRFDLSPLEYRERETYQAYMPLVRQSYEQRCLDEFWNNEEKYPGIGEKHKEMTDNAVDPVYGITQFRDLLDKYDDPVIISDNVAFDCRMINHYLDVAGLALLNYDKTTTNYRSNFDSDSYSRGVMRMNYDNVWTSDSDLIEQFDLSANKDNHNHLPENDAEYIYRFHMELVNKVEPLKKRIKK